MPGPLSPRPARIVEALPPRPDARRVRVGALDGRHPKAGERALRRIAHATTDDALDC